MKAAVIRPVGILVMQSEIKDIEVMKRKPQKGVEPIRLQFHRVIQHPLLKTWPQIFHECRAGRGKASKIPVPGHRCSVAEYFQIQGALDRAEGEQAEVVHAVSIREWENTSPQRPPMFFFKYEA